MEVNEVPRRLIIHFFHEFNEEDIKELNNDITVTPTYENIFIKGDKNRQLRSNHQKGHVNKDGVYIKHTEMKGKRKDFCHDFHAIYRLIFGDHSKNQLSYSFGFELTWLT